jgi:hypothetical protein
MLKTAVAEKRCSYENCKRPEESSQFIQIDGNSTAGSQDWKALAGKVICNACYNQYFKKGTLCRSQNQGKAIPEASRHCSYEHCKRPHESSRFFCIDGASTAGDKDWKPVAGRILCHTCYLHYRARGTLERGQPLSASAKRCTYENCKRPDVSRQFIQIDGTSTAGNQDWKSLEGKVLCHTCYYQYLRRGTLERSKARPTPTTSSKPPATRIVPPAPAAASSAPAPAASAAGAAGASAAGAAGAAGAAAAAAAAAAISPVAALAAAAAAQPAMKAVVVGAQTMTAPKKRPLEDVDRTATAPAAMPPPPGGIVAGSAAPVPKKDAVDASKAKKAKE